MWRSQLRAFVTWGRLGLGQGVGLRTSNLEWCFQHAPVFREPPAVCSRQTCCCYWVIACAQGGVVSGLLGHLWGCSCLGDNTVLHCPTASTQSYTARDCPFERLSTEHPKGHSCYLAVQGTVCSPLFLCSCCKADRESCLPLQWACSLAC